MLKKLLIVFLVLVVLLGAFAGYVAMQPGEYRVERGITINAPADVVFAQVNDFHKWDAWSPWAELDPDAKYSYDGPASGKGTIFSWSGNDNVGEGRMTILESTPSELIRIKLDFLKPMEASCTTEFKFKSKDEQTDVTWTMTGQNDFVGKLFCVFMNMDQMIGADFEKGLANMKSVAESSAKAVGSAK